MPPRIVGGSALLLGLLAGLICGARNRDPRVGWGWSLVLLFGGGVTAAGVLGALEGEVLSMLGASVVLALLLVPIAGAIPAALGCFGAFHLTVFIKKRL